MGLATPSHSRAVPSSSKGTCSCATGDHIKAHTSQGAGTQLSWSSSFKHFLASVWLFQEAGMLSFSNLKKNSLIGPIVLCNIQC